MSQSNKLGLNHSEIDLKIPEHLKVEIDGVLMIGIESTHLVEIAVEFEDVSNEIKNGKIHLHS